MSDYSFPGQHSRDGMVLEGPCEGATIDQLETFDMVDGDILIATYPKAGTTWMEELVWLVSNQGDVNKARTLPLHQRMHYLEYKLNGVTSGLEEVLKMPRPCIMKTHLQAGTFKSQVKAGKVKVIVVIRNPKDVLVSFYNFYRMNRALGNFPGSWDEFYELYKARGLIYGDYFDWYASWLEHVDKPNVALIKYEDMKRRMPEVLKRACSFLGKTMPDDVISDVIQHLSFDSMKENRMTNYADVPLFNMEVSAFIRKGRVGDWKNYFSVEQSAEVDEWYRERIESTGVVLEFE